MTITPGCWVLRSGLEHEGAWRVVRIILGVSAEIVTPDKRTRVAVPLSSLTVAQAAPDGGAA